MDESLDLWTRWMALGAVYFAGAIAVWVDADPWVLVGLGAGAFLVDLVREEIA